MEDNATKNRILIVDDTPEDIQFLLETLKNNFAVVAVTSGEKALEAVANGPRPDVVLMDVTMPGMDGYETCRKLKEDQENSDIDVIFVSAHDTTEEKIAGYEAGGSDYLIKPVQPSELEQKVKLAIKNNHIRSDISTEKDMAFNAAMTAMASASEQGIVLDFMRRSFSANNTKDLAALIVESTAGFDLENSVQVRSNEKIVNHGTREPMPPLEIELLERLKNHDRIVSLGKRTIFNYGEISLLVKNMPEDDEKRGRLRDHLAILAEGAEHRLAAIEASQNMVYLVEDSNKTLKDIQAVQAIQKEKGLEIMDEVLRGIEASFMTLGLTDEQEELTLEIINTGVEESIKNLENGMIIDQKFQEIISSLMSFCKK